MLAGKGTRSHQNDRAGPAGVPVGLRHTVLGGAPKRGGGGGALRCPGQKEAGLGQVVEGAQVSPESPGL